MQPNTFTEADHLRKEAAALLSRLTARRDAEPTERYERITWLATVRFMRRDAVRTQLIGRN